MRKFILLGLLAFVFHFSNNTDRIMVYNLTWENCTWWPAPCVVAGGELSPGESSIYRFDGDSTLNHYWEVRWIPARQYWEFEPEIDLFFKRQQEGSDVHFYLEPGKEPYWRCGDEGV